MPYSPLIIHSNDAQKNKAKPVLLLHGAGVAGQTTWGHFVPMLDSVGDIYIPDLRGMGAHKNEQAFEIDDIVDDMQSLLNSIDANDVVLVGYSFGGLVAMLLAQKNPDKIKQLILVEPASLERESFELTQTIRQNYQQLAKDLSNEALQTNAVRQFIDLVCPNRQANKALAMKIEAMMIERLLQRPSGFANALNAVSNYLTTILDTQKRALLINDLPETHLFTGANSSQHMVDYHQKLAESEHISHYLVAGTDHTLPYQKPRRVAKIINDISQF
jgi:pimeloyl-ACP methyl ester carboxylesterase